MSYLVTSTNLNSRNVTLNGNFSLNLTGNLNGNIVGDLTGNMQGATEFQAVAGEALNKGEPVYISRFDETNGTYIVQKADAKDQNKMPCVGLTKETVAVDGNVKVVTSGLLNNLNTNAFLQGDILYVSINAENAGALTKVKPSKSNNAFLLTQSIGKVMRKHDTQGSVNIIIGEVDVPNLNHKNVFIGNSENITENRQLVLDDFSNLGTTTISSNTVEGKTLDEIFEKMRSKFCLVGGGKISWTSSYKMEWTKRILIIPFGQVLGIYVTIPYNNITIEPNDIAFIRPSDVDYNGTSNIGGSIELQLRLLKDYSTLENNDIVIAFHNSENNQLTLMNGIFIDKGYTFDNNGTRTYKGPIGIQTNSPDFSLQVGGVAEPNYYHQNYLNTPLAVPLTYEHTWGVDGPGVVVSNAFFFNNTTSEIISNVRYIYGNMSGSIAFGGINQTPNEHTIYARMGGRLVENFSGDLIFQTMHNDNSGNLQIDMMIGHTQSYDFSFLARVGINTTIPDEQLHVVGNANITGSISKSAGSFDIPHPDPQKKDTHRLRHYFVETPSAGGNIYKYQIYCTKGVNIMDLPDYFRFLNKDGLVWVDSYKHFGGGWGDIIDGGRKLEIHAEQDGIYKVFVFADRKDPLAMENFNKYGIEYKL